MVKLVQHSFLGGQLDFEMMGRQDIERYTKGATKLLNFIPLKRGAIRKRPGTNLLHDVTERIGGGRCRLVPFAYKRSEGWAILATEGAMLAVGGDATVEVEKDEDIEFFTGAAVEEFDYCQSGDVMFLAHIDHPPCKLEHRVDETTGEHSFRLVKFIANAQAEGVPRVSGATVSKTGITTKGPMVTEYYRVSAVFDGRETFPSETYSNPRRNDYDSSYDQWRKDIAAAEKKGKVSALEYQPNLKTYNGTAYTPPWTQSQKITLTIDVEKAMVKGSLVYPDQVRIYRKTGSLYGLVGFVDTKEITSDVVVQSISNSNETVVDPDIFKGSDPDAVSAYGFDADTYTLPAGTTTFTMQTISKAVKIAIFPGRLSVEYAETAKWVWSDEATGRTATYDNGRWKYGSNSYAKAAYVLDGNGEEVEQDGAIYVPSEPEEGLTLEFTISGKTVYARYGRTADFTYTRSRNASSTTVYFRHGAAKEMSFTLKDASKDLSFSCPRRKDEDDAAFQDRAKSEADAYLAANGCTVSAEVEPDEGNSNIFTIRTTYALNIAGIIVEGKGNDESKSKIAWDDKYYTPDASQTPPRRERYMDAPGDWPACVCLSQQRLVWASTRNDPSRVIMSMTGDFETYAPHDVMVDDDPIDFMVSATRFPKVNHLVELRKLLMFNGAAEWIVDSASSTTGITYASIQARQHSSIGAAAWLKPITCNNVILFAEATGQAVRQYGYQLEDDGYGGDDISIFSSSIFRGRRIVSWAYQQFPHSTCWCVLSDGGMCSLTFMREQSTIAWATHELGGGGRARAVVCTEAITGNAGSLDDTSQTFVLVERGGRFTVEEMRCDCAHGSDSVANALCLDSARTLHEGDARREGTVAVDPSSGAAIEGAADGAIEGYAFESEFTSVHPVVAEDIGLSLMDVRCVQAAHLRLADAGGGTVRSLAASEDEASELLNTVPEVSDGVVQLANTDENVPLVTGNGRDGRVSVKQDGYWPFTLLTIETDIECEENPGRRG